MSAELRALAVITTEAQSTPSRQRAPDLDRQREAEAEDPKPVTHDQSSDQERRRECRRKPDLPRARLRCEDVARNRVCEYERYANEEYAPEFGHAIPVPNM